MVDAPPSLVEIGTQIYPPFTFNDRGVQTEDVPPYIPFIVEASIRLMQKTMEG